MGEIADKIDLFKVDSETFISYCQEKGVLSDPSSDEYATQRFIAAGASGTESTESEGDAEAETTTTEVGVGAETTQTTEGDAGTAEASTTPKSSSYDIVSSVLSLVVTFFAIAAVVYV